MRAIALLRMNFRARVLRNARSLAVAFRGHRGRRRRPVGSRLREFQKVGTIYAGAPAAAGGAVVQHFGYQALFAVLAVIGLIWLAVASTLSIPPRAQRLSLAVSVQTEHQANQLAAQLTALAGVQEVTLLLAEQRCYLKVSSAQFDTAQAQAIIAAASAE